MDAFNIDGFIKDDESIKKSIKESELDSKRSNSIDKENMDSFEKYAMHQINSRNVFNNNPYYDLSSRLINDEKNCSPNFLYMKKKEIKSLDVLKKIKKPVDVGEFINFRKFLTLNDESILNILGFSFPFFSEIMKSNKHISRKFHLALNNKYANLIFLCRENFMEHLELEEFIFLPSVYKRHRVAKPSN